MLPWLLCGVLALVAVYFAGKVRALHRTMEELEDHLAHWLDRDSNNHIALSDNRDPYARRLATTLDRQLTELRRHRRRWQRGDRELKEAVTNLSHDLRTPSPPWRAIWNCWSRRNSPPSKDATWPKFRAGRRP